MIKRQKKNKKNVKYVGKRERKRYRERFRTIINNYVS